MSTYQLPVAKYSLGRRVVFKEINGEPQWGTVESFYWHEGNGEYAYIIACANGAVIKLLQSQLRGFDQTI